MNEYHVYIVKCSDDSYYTGVTSTINKRISEHNHGIRASYTKSRRPVNLVYNRMFRNIQDAIRAEKQIKRWSKKKKEALINNDIDLLKKLSKSRT